MQILGYLIVPLFSWNSCKPVRPMAVLFDKRPNPEGWIAEGYMSNPECCSVPPPHLDHDRPKKVLKGAAKTIKELDQLLCKEKLMCS